MLCQLKINNYLLLNHLELDFKSGLTIVTGETGSGKSIIIDGLMIIFGKKINKEVITQNSANFEAVFELGQASAISWLKENDLINHDDHNHLICRRSCDSLGKNKFYINGFNVTKTQIEILGEILLDIHTQHASINLLKESTQRELLDQYAGITSKVDEIKTLYQNIQSLTREINDLDVHNQSALDKINYLKNAIDELSNLNMQANTWEELEEQQRKLSNVQTTLNQINDALNLIENQDSSVIQQLKQLSQYLHKLSGIETKASEIAKLCDESLIQINEISYELNQIAKNTVDDPQTLNQLEERMDQIFTLARKHKINPQGIPEYIALLTNELKQLIPTTNLGELQKQLSEYQDQYNTLSQEISIARKQAADTLNTKINKILPTLAINGNFTINVIDSKANSFGTNKIEYQVSFNQGMAPQALTTAISGGELSRVALALYLELSQNITPEVIIFDEIDVGIGGKIAALIGQMLKNLSNQSQVICITHQPQTASFAGSHLKVSKHNQEGSTITKVEWINDKSQVEEIARMLSGINITETTLTHAKEMLKQHQGAN